MHLASNKSDSDQKRGAILDGCKLVGPKDEDFRSFYLTLKDTYSCPRVAWYSRFSFSAKETLRIIQNTSVIFFLT